MMSIPEDIFVVLVAIAGSLAVWWLIQRVWPSERRREHNDITGWQLSVLGTTYAVIIGFMLFAAWADFRAADQNAEVEASCLINLYWAASGLPEGQRKQIRELAADYADEMITEEWPAMSRGVVTEAATQIVQNLWATVAQSQSFNPAQQVSLERTMAEISSVAEHRRVRQMQNETTLPGVLWIVLISGAIMTLMSSCLFGSQDQVLHLLQIVSLALLLSLALIAVADINRPFRGAVHVMPTGFENAKRIFEKYGGVQGAH